jgi:hypothetical protein
MVTKIKRGAVFFPLTLIVVALSALAGALARAPRADRRRRIVDEARRVDGLTAGGDPLAFASALGILPAGGWSELLARPFALETREDGTIQTAGVSTCALVAREILRRAGLALPSLEVPYVPGSGIREILDAGQQARALHRSDGDGYLVRPGDLVVLGIAGGDHVATVVDVEGEAVTTVDGGLVAPDGLQRIGHVTRSMAAIAAGVAIDVDRLPWHA